MIAGMNAATRTWATHPACAPSNQSRHRMLVMHQSATGGLGQGRQDALCRRQTHFRAHCTSLPMSRARFAAIVPLAVVVLLCVVHGVAAKWEGLGAHCAEELVEPCENGLVCHNATCSFCSSEIPCGQGFACRKEPDGSTCKRMPLYSRFTWQEGVASAIVFLAGGLAAGTGLGGGGIFVPTFVMVAGLNAHEVWPACSAARRSVADMFDARARRPCRSPRPPCWAARS